MAAFRYYRFYCTAGNATAIMISEIELIGLVSGSDITSPSTTVAADGSQGGSRTPDKTVQNDGATTGWQYNAAYPHWLRVDLGFGNEKEITGYTIRADAQNAYAPTAWTLQGSNDATNWMNLDTQSGQSFTTEELKTFSTLNGVGVDRKLLSGTCNDSADAPAKRVIRLHSRATGAVLFETESNASTGAWEIDTLGNTEAMYAVAFDFASIINLRTLVSLPMTGANNSTTFTDYCGAAFAAVGDAKISTADYPALTGQTTSAYFDGNDSVRSSQSSLPYIMPQLAVGGGDFCIEVYAKLTSNSGDQYRELFILAHPAGIMSIRYGNSGFGYKLQVSLLSSAVGNVWSCAKTQTTDLNTWQLLTLERYNGTCRLYVAGTVQSINSGANPITYPVTSFSDSTSIGQGVFYLGNSWAGYVGPMRFVAYAPYRGTNFTPPSAPWGHPAVGGAPENSLILSELRPQ